MLYEAFEDPFGQPDPHEHGRGRGHRGHGHGHHGRGAPGDPFGGRGPFGRGDPFSGGGDDPRKQALRAHRGRQRKGDVRAAVLALLSENAMHGYEMIKEIGSRSGGFWQPSPGSVYPTLQLLADEGLVESEDKPGGRKLFSLTEDGRTEAAKFQDAPPWEAVMGGVDPKEITLRQEMGQLAAAVRQVSAAASTDQKQRAARILSQARRDLYGILAEPTDTGDDE